MQNMASEKQIQIKGKSKTKVRANPLESINI